jgi:DNA-binding NarL/FixJ family response regulator
MPESAEYIAAQRALDNANRYFEVVDNVYPRALELSGKFGKLALGFAELLPITTRHISILDDISHGMTKEQALTAVGLKSFKTIEITEALDVKTMNQAIIKAYELGLLPAYKSEVEIGAIRKTLMEIWASLTSGLSREEIANARNVTTETIATQLHELYSVTGAVNQPNAVRIGLEAGITSTESSSQGKANRVLMAASALTAFKLWSIVPINEYPEDVRYGELPPVALSTLYRGTKSLTYDGRAKKTLSLSRIGEISGGQVQVKNIEDDRPEPPAPVLDKESLKSAREKLSELTENEHNVAILIAAGYSVLEIEHRLSLSQVTVLTYSSNVRRTLGVSRNGDVAGAVGPVGLEELPPPIKPEKESDKVLATRREGKKFMWEESYEQMVIMIIDRLKKAGANPDMTYPLEDEVIINMMLKERLIDEAEAEQGLLPLNKFVRALLLKTSEGKRIRSAFEGKNRALRTIDELIEAQKWE